MAEIGVEIHALDRSGRGIKQAEKSMGRLKTAVRGVTSVAKTAALGIGGIAIAGAGIGTAIAAQFVGAGRELNRFSNRTGHTVEQLSAMRYAAERVGYELEDMIDVTEEMRIKANDAAEGSADMAARFAELGINVEEFLQLSPDEQFNATAEALHNVEDATRRTILADELLSDTGKRLLEITQSNADGFAGLAAEADAAGRIMGQETVDQVVRLEKSFNELKDKGLGLAMEGFEALAPVLADAADAAIAFVDNTLPKIIDWSTNVFDRFGAAKDRVGDVFDAFKNRGLLGAIQETLNPAKETVDSFKKSLDDTSAPITTVIEQLRSLQGIGADATYTPHPVLAGIQGDVAEIAAALDPGLKETLQSFSGSTGSQLTAPIQEIADTIPAVRKAFEDETPLLNAAISGYTMAAGDVRDVGATVGDVRDKVDFNIQAMAARLGPLGFPVAALWQGIQGGFKTGREKTVAEVVSLNTDLDMQLTGSTATGGTLGSITIANALFSTAWGVMADIFATGRKDTVAEVEGLKDDLATEIDNTVAEMNSWEVLLKPAQALLIAGWRGMRVESLAHMVGMNIETAGQIDVTRLALNVGAAILTGKWSLISDSFKTGATDSVAAMEGMNSDIETESATTTTRFTGWKSLLSARWKDITGAFTLGRDDTVAEMIAFNTYMQGEQDTTNSGFNLWSVVLDGWWETIVHGFGTGRTDTIGEMQGLNSDLQIETTTTNQGLGFWTTILGASWIGIRDAFGLGRGNVNTEMQGLNSDLQVETTTTTDGLNLWNVVLGGWWSVIRGTFGIGRKDVNTEMQGLNMELQAETDVTNTGLDLWVDILKVRWEGLTGQFETGVDNSIEEIARVGVSIGDNTASTATGIDLWALSMHQRFQDFKRTISGPVDAILGVIGRIGNAVSNALNALNNLRRSRAQGIPNVSSALNQVPPSRPANPRGGRGGPTGGAPQIQLASGGIVTQPTFALIGEAGPEAVIPLSGGGGPFGRNVVVNVYVGGSVVSEHELHNRITRSVNEAIRHEAI